MWTNTGVRVGQTTHPLLAARSRMSRAIPQFPVWAPRGLLWGDLLQMVLPQGSNGSHHVQSQEFMERVFQKHTACTNFQA
jgi:hypothetical protein